MTMPKAMPGGADVLDLRAAQGQRWIDAAFVAYSRAFDHPFKLRLVRALGQTLMQGRVVIKYANNMLIGVDPNDYIGWSITKTGHYEQASLRLALSIMRDDPGLFVDVGANIGLYSCAIGLIPGCTIVSIEADCENCARLRENASLNNIPNIHVVNCAVAQRVELVSIERKSTFNAGSVAVTREGWRRGKPDDWVACLPLDDVLAQVLTAPVRPTLLKLDVEGFEPEVLAGIDFGGSFRPKNVLLEFVSSMLPEEWKKLGALQAFFADRGYVLMDVEGKRIERDGDALIEDNVWARSNAS